MTQEICSYLANQEMSRPDGYPCITTVNVVVRFSILYEASLHITVSLMCTMRLRLT